MPAPSFRCALRPQKAAYSKFLAGPVGFDFAGYAEISVPVMLRKGKNG